MAEDLLYPLGTQWLFDQPDAVIDLMSWCQGCEGICVGVGAGAGSKVFSLLPCSLPL